MRGCRNTAAPHALFGDIGIEFAQGGEQFGAVLRLHRRQRQPQVVAAEAERSQRRFDRDRIDLAEKCLGQIE